MMGTASSEVTLSAGMDILIAYLVASPISPVQTAFVATGEASGVTLTKSGNVQTVYCFNFENVPTHGQEGVGPKLRKVLEEEYNGKFNPERMEMVVGRCCQEAMSAMENDAEDTIAVISDFIYSFSNDLLTFDRRINRFYTLEQFGSQPARFWLKMLKTLLDSNWALVYAVPSKETGDPHDVEDEERQTEILEKMGPEGCKKLGARLKAAIKIQAKPPPPQMLSFIKTPSIGSIGFLGIERHDNPSWATRCATCTWMT
ncbi:uncharacterized protein LOC110848296 [Folsomia candida]|uniref:uncharacterized protein LOC110848296 n=1 Tax=Folsomia candida TaxID=158441 RepID=UPI001604F9D3|nr:uncharacterized protein LOC110848296 [Folsomia candida]